MSYVDEVIDLVVKQNPCEPEFHQAVKEVLNSLRPVVDANEEKFRRDAVLERIVNPERQILPNFFITSNLIFSVCSLSARSIS